MNVSDELQKLQELHQSGAISDDEFSLAKAKLLHEPPPLSGGPPSPLADASPSSAEQQARQWAMFLHLSQFAGFLVPLAGLVLPIVLWQLKKAEMPGIDAHGRVVVNWIISAVIYAIAGALLVFVFVGIPLLIALGVVGIIFPIVGGVKASNGELWRYPLSIKFLK